MADTTTVIPPPEDDMADDEENAIIELCSLFDEQNEDCICEFGDIVLVVNDGFHPIQKLRVSSCVLAMSSRVFKVLFSGRFAEGLAAKDRSSSQPYEVEIQDAPVPMKQLCRLLHHQEAFETEDKSANVLLDLAILIDKYDCCSTVYLQADALLQHATDSHFETIFLQEPYGLQRLVTAAYILDQPLHFRHLSSQLVLQTTMIQVKDFEASCLDILPESFVGSLFNQQNMAQQELSRQVARLVMEFKEAARGASRNSLLVDFLDNLGRSSGLWLPDAKHTLCTQLDGLEEIELPLVPLPDGAEMSNADRSGSGYQSLMATGGWLAFDHKQLKAPTEKSLKERAASVREICVGVCLDCIQHRECRKSHRHLWKYSESDSCFPWGAHHDAESASFGTGPADFFHFIEYPGYWEKCW